MKRILSLVLILILSLGVLTACGEPTHDFTRVTGYVRSLVNEELSSDSIKSDLTLYNTIAMSGTTYKIAWTTNSPNAVVEAGSGDTDTLKVTQSSEDVSFKLTATITAPNGATDNSLSFDLKIPALAVEPVLDLMGNANLVSGSGEQNVFAANGITFTNDKASSTSALIVADYAQRAYAGSTIKIEAQGMRKIVITCDDYTPDGKKYYYTGMDGMVVEGATIVRKDAVITILFLDGPVNVFQSTALAGQIRIKQIEVFNTLTAEDKELANNNNNNNGETPKYQAPETGKAFKWYMDINGTRYYFKAGTLDQDKYLLSTTNLAESTDIYFEVVDGGYHIYYMEGSTRTYINSKGYKGSKGYLSACFELGTTPNCVWTYNDTFGIFEVEQVFEGFEPDTFFAGTYGSYTTISMSGSYYKNQISSGSQYPARLVLSSEAANATPPAGGNTGNSGNTNNNTNTTCPLVVGKGYKVKAANSNGPLWLASGTTDNRFNGTANEADALVVYIENVDGGYLIYTMNGSTKTYICMTDAAAGAATATNKAEATVYEWNGTLNTFVVAEDGNNRGFATDSSKDFTTFSAYDAVNGSKYVWGQFTPVN